jgi:hypothetical protein
VIQFLSPIYLYGLSLLIIPIIIHLFNFRRYKKVLFTNVRFLQELKEETTRVSRLKHLLVLLTRLLAIAFIVLAFAQPVIPVGTQAAQNLSEPVSIYIDNSFSMDAISSQGALLEVARQKATEIANSYPATTRFQLLTNDFDAFRQRLISKDDFLDELNRVKFSAQPRRISEVLLRQKEVATAGSAAGLTSYLISDFQQSTSNFEEVIADSSMQVKLVVLPLQPTSNLFVDSCWLSSPIVQLGQALEFTLSLQNSSDKDAENVPVRFMLNGTQKAVTSLTVPAGQKMETTFSFTASASGWQKATIKIADHPLNFDDDYYFSFEVKEKMHVMSISEDASPYLEALFSKDPFFEYRRSNASNVDYASFRQQDLIVVHSLRQISSGLSEELKKYVEAGGSICLFPDSSADLNNVNQFLSSVNADAFTGINESNDKVSDIDLQHVLFKDVFDNNKAKDGRIDYPAVAKHYDQAGNSTSARQILMKLQGGGAFLSMYPFGKGQLYVFSVPLQTGFSNLARHAIFVPVLYRMAILTAKPLSFAHTIGSNEAIILNAAAPTGDEAFHLINKETQTDIIPAARAIASGLLIDLGNQVQKAGHFDLMKGNQVIEALAFNYDRDESEMLFYDEEVIQEKIETLKLENWSYFNSATPDLKKTLLDLNNGISLWKYAIISALVCLLLEILLIRFWKTA